MKRFASFLAVIVLCVSAAYAAQADEEMTMYENDFSSLSGIYADSGISLSQNPLDADDTSLHFEAGRYKTAEIKRTLDILVPVNLEGRLYREYMGNDSPYWDLRLFLLTDNEPIMLTAFGKNVYLGNAWENISVFDYQDAAWSDFRIRMVKGGETLTAELFLDGNSYGEVAQTVSGNVTGVRIGAYCGMSGSVYVDDVALVSEPSSLEGLISGIAAETASAEDCSTWLEVLSEKEDNLTSDYYYNIIYKYAQEKGFITEGILKSAFPADGEKIYAGDGLNMRYVYSGRLSEESTPVVTLKKGGTAVSGVSAEINKQMLMISAPLEPNSSYTLEVTGLENSGGTDVDFGAVSFSTQSLPVVNIAEGGSYIYGTKVKWNDSSGVTVSAMLTAQDGSEKEIKNGDIITSFGNNFLTLTSENEEHTICFFIIINGMPTAENVRIEVDEDVLRGKYDYADAEGDEQDVPNTLSGWYLSDEKDSGYQHYADGDMLQINSTLYNKYVKFGVIPVSYQAPTTGSIAYSDAFALPSQPVAKDVRISGKAVEGNTLTGFYDYFDANGDAENGETVMQWVTSSGSVIGKGL